VRTAADNNPAVEGEGVPGPINGEEPFRADVCRLGTVTIGGRVKVLARVRVEEEAYAVAAGLLDCFCFSGDVQSAPVRKKDPDTPTDIRLDDVVFCDGDCALAALEAVDLDQRLTFKFPPPWCMPLRLVERRCAYVVVGTSADSGVMATGGALCPRPLDCDGDGPRSGARTSGRMLG
jgi:hypothetical protein